MKKVNVEKFLADYEIAVKEKETLEVAKEEAISLEKSKAEQVCLQNGYSEHIKEALIEAAIAEKQKEFSVEAVDQKVAKFEEYLIDIEDENSEDENNSEESSEQNNTDEQNI
jgi:hypothetical protein